MDNISDVNYKIGSEHFRTQNDRNIGEPKRVRKQTEFEDSSDNESYLPDNTDLMYSHDPLVLELEEPNLEHQPPLPNEKPLPGGQRREVRRPVGMYDYR